MSREDEGGCKLTSVYKHKERKPKKPHYIPRPWGKPYNYKCFQCPFTCMEKSHLYNHMKYSLCKNSLSLLIESDWPYKKGNLLHPELHLLHATEALRHRSHQSDESDTSNSDAHPAKPAPNGGLEEGSKGETMTTDGSRDDQHQFEEEEEEEEEDEEEAAIMSKEMDQRQKKEEGQDVGSQGTPVDHDVGTVLLGLKNKKNKPCKEVEPDFMITDVYSLKNKDNNGKESVAVEPEIKSKDYKMPTNCHVTEDALMEQWKLLSNGSKRAAQEVPPQSTEAKSMPCYPPPAYSDYHEQQGLNLSLLGINYPLSPNLFSYLAPTMANSLTSHPHLTQLPFLASTTQLMPPHSTHFQPIQNQDRSTFLPRFYYPLLFEHSFGSCEGKMAAGKAEVQQPTGSPAATPSHIKLLGEARKDGMRKIPIVNNNIPGAASLRERPLPPDICHKVSLVQEEEEKWSGDGSKAKQTLNSLHQKAASVVYRNTMLGFRDGTSLPNRIRKSDVTMAACLEMAGASNGSLKRKSSCGSGTDFLKDIIATENLRNSKFNYQTSLHTARQLPTTMDRHWPPEYTPSHAKIPVPEALPSRIATSGQPDCKRKHLQDAPETPGDMEAATQLIGDLSKTLGEYQEVEKKLSDLAKKDNPRQKELREQLVKIRRELQHVHQALEKSSKPHEGPLDLSVKKSSDVQEKSKHTRKEAFREPLGGSMNYQCREHTTNLRPESPIEESDDEDTTFFSPTDEDSQAIEMMIRMSRSESLRSTSEMQSGSAVKTEVLPPELQHVMEPYYNRTTKCEADSSVLLTTDGRCSQPAQGPPQLLAHEEGTLAVRANQHPGSCTGVSVATEIICLHSPLTTD
ncbi:proline-rich protein 35 [Lissotriton helveticus]